MHRPVRQKFCELCILECFSFLNFCNFCELSVQCECSSSCSGHRKAKHRHLTQHCTCFPCQGDTEVASLTQTRAPPFSIADPAFSSTASSALSAARLQKCSFVIPKGSSPQSHSTEATRGANPCGSGRDEPEQCLSSGENAESC